MNVAARLYQDLDQFTLPVGAYQFADSPAALGLNLGSRIDDIAVAACNVTAPEREELQPGCDRARLLVQAPTVWHAVVHLIHENRNWLSGRYGGIRAPLIFRGQRDTAWSIVPSVNRVGVDRGHEERSARCFAKLAFAALRVNRVPRLLPQFVDALTEFAPEPMADQGSMHVAWAATAQHYGIGTPLLDFTMDPAVAAWFACQGADEGHEVAVFALPTQWTHHAGVNIKLPHPLSDRLFRQRGIFVDGSRLSPSDLRQLCIEVRFPADHGFRPLRRRYRTEVFPPDPWWQKAVTSAREIARGDAVNAFLHARADRIDLERLVGSSRFAEPDELFDRFAHSVRELTQMLVAFTVSIENDSVSPLRDGIRSFTRENREFLQLMLPAVRASLLAVDDGAALRDVGLQMTEFIDDELTSSTTLHAPAEVGRAPNGQSWSDWAVGIVTIGGMHLLRDVTKAYLEPACDALRAAGATVTVQLDSGGVYLLFVRCKR